MPDPYKKQVADKIWALLEARSAFTTLVLAGNKLKQSDDGWLRERIHRAPADFPQVQLTNGRFTHTGYTQHAPTYDREKVNWVPSATSDAIVHRRLEFKLTITNRDAVNTVIDQLEEEAQTALLAGGDRWGLSFVLNWGAVFAEQRELRTQQALRLQSVITIPVTLEVSAYAVINAA